MEFTKTMFSTLQSEIKELRAENSDIKRSLSEALTELTEVKEVQSRASLGEKVGGGSVPGHAIEQLSERLRVVEDFTRKSNIIVDGLAESKTENNETLQVKIKDTFIEKLSIDPNIITVHRLGKGAPNKGPRPVIVKLRDFE